MMTSAWHYEIQALAKAAVAEMKPKTGERSVLLLLIVYCLDLVWKLANWHQLTDGLDWWMTALALGIRFAFMGGLLLVFLRLRKAARSASKP
jgi:hypothetical protein